ncbi:hypothetical protein [Acidithiobacillus ferriphilus]|uniref:hypothetical protein n=1 Tax=Acidithiobacillus ferriphilus TaxID=1689834 RepID=UPI00233048FC|nr:hypothetical protein [Acidithiobacillus ferriphilus]WCE94247.1 hypothetical protein PJU76_01505 [Acidithiobacillus ferriphilus]
MSLLGWATVALAGATTVSVVFTAWMAAKTSALAKFNQQIIEQNERHHTDEVQNNIDNQRPVVILDAELNPEIRENRNIFDLIAHDHWRAYYSGAQGNVTVLAIACEIKNVGKGIALNPTILIRFENNSGKELISEFSPLAVGASRQLEIAAFHTGNNSYFLDPHQNFKTDEYQNLPSQTWDIFIRYYDIYGNVYYTRHPKDPNQRWVNIGERGEDIPPGKSKEQIASELALLKALGSSKVISSGAKG